jgi:hypothetical protein
VNTRAWPVRLAVSVSDLADRKIVTLLLSVKRPERKRSSKAYLLSVLVGSCCGILSLKLAYRMHRRKRSSLTHYDVDLHPDLYLSLQLTPADRDFARRSRELNEQLFSLLGIPQTVLCSKTVTSRSRSSGVL